MKRSMMVFLLACAQFRDSVQASRDPREPDAGSVPGERGDEPVPALPVGDPGPANMPVVGP